MNTSNTPPVEDKTKEILGKVIFWTVVTIIIVFIYSSTPLRYR
ncbi:hypothetical protein [Flavobacterium caseinilyticum]|nr:hypothetical protein [Flavobacterium caseinilyticum]